MDFADGLQKEGRWQTVEIQHVLVMYWVVGLGWRDGYL